MAARPKFVGDAEHLIPAWASDSVEAVSQPGIQASCDVCGLVGAGSYGFGSFRTTRGIWACSDLDCRAEAKSRASGQRNLIAAE